MQLLRPQIRCWSDTSSRLVNVVIQFSKMADRNTTAVEIEMLQKYDSYKTIKTFVV